MKKAIQRIGGVLLIWLSLYACTDDYFEFDKIKTSELRPEFAIPVVSSSLTLEDIIIKEDTGEQIQTDPNTNVLEVIYDGSVFSAVGGQLVDLPDQSFNENTPLVFPPGPQSFTTNANYNVNFNTTVEVDSLLLREGDLVLTLESTMQHPMDVKLELPGFIDQFGQSLAIDFSLPASNGSTPVVRSDISGLDDFLIDMTDNGTTYNTIPLELTITIRRNPSTSSTTGNLRLAGDIRNLEFKEFVGYLGKDSIELREDTINVNLFKNFKTGVFFISNPSLDINISNSYALPAQMNFEKLIARNQDRMPDTLGIDLPTDPNTGSSKQRELNSPQRYGTAITDLDLDTNNSNIDDVISFLLKQIVYDTKAIFNPDDNRNNRNFITDTSGIGLDVLLKIPFEGRAKNFILIDTIDFEFEIAEDIEQGAIRLIADNGFPIDVELQLVFADSSYQALDSLYSGGPESAIPAAPVNINGDAIGTSRKITDAIVTRSRFSKLQRSQYAIIRANLNTQNASQNQNVRFFPNYRLDVAVGLRAKLLLD